MMKTSLLTAYREYLLDEDRSPATIEKYLRDVGHFLAYVGEEWQIEKETVRNYKQKLKDTYKITSSLVYKGRKVALYGGAYAPSYLPNDVDTFACGVNCGNH